jgi:hypothetical protein
MAAKIPYSSSALRLPRSARCCAYRSTPRRACAPWSVLKTSGGPKRASASSSAATQKSCCQRVRKPESEYLATSDIKYGRQEHKSARHRDITNIRGPHLVRPRDLQARQQVGVNRGLPRRDARARLAVERFDSHAAHQGSHVQPPNITTLSSQLFRYALRAIVPMIQMQLLDPPHQLQVLLDFRDAMNRKASPPVLERMWGPVVGARYGS